MAKGARASSKKANRTALRARVFGPVEQARAERLHAKLVETVRQPKPEQTAMDTAEDANTNTPGEATKEHDLPKRSSFLTDPSALSGREPRADCAVVDMEVDGATITTKSSRKNKDKSQTRKQLRRKPQNKVTFPTSRGKGALKPFTGGRSGGRVGKR
ncbi:hypothetical protein BDW02DRAFT_454262, partial [Decorospora gaudefroyi]